VSNVLRRQAMVTGQSREATAHPALVSWGLGLSLVIATVWTFWSTIEGLRDDWRVDDNYSVGQIVPFAALYLLWTERHALSRLPVRTCYWGIALLLAAQAGRFFGLIRLYESAERYALVLTIAGIVLLVAGWRIFWQVRWILLFLFLMIPLPGRVHNLISGPLQTQATTGAVFALELLGVTVSQDGNVTETELWGKRSMAYPIRDFFEGYYILHRLQMSGSLVDEIERQWRFSEDVIRYLFVRTDA